jgi:hypothetical protein
MSTLSAETTFDDRENSPNSPEAVESSPQAVGGGEYRREGVNRGESWPVQRKSLPNKRLPPVGLEPTTR